MIDSFPDRGSIRFLKIRDAGGVLNATFALVRRNAREVFFGVGAIMIPLALVSGISQALFISDVGGLFNPVESSADPFEVFGPSYFVLLIAGLVGTVIVQAATVGYVRLYREGLAGEITPGLLWEETQRLILPTFAFTFVTLLGLMLSGILLVTFGALVGMAVGPVVGTILIFALLIGFWAWLFPYINVAWASRLIESDSVFTSIGRSITLVRGAWGFAFGASFLIWVVTFVIAIVLSMPTQVLSAVAGTAGTGGTAVLAAVTVPQAILGYLAYVLPSFGVLFIHGRLVAEVDGTDLDDDLDLLELGLDAAPADSWSDETITAMPPSPSLSPEDDPADEEPEAGPGGFRGGGFS